MILLVRALFCLSAVGVLAFIAHTELLVFRSPIRRRWLWALIVLVAAPTTILSWQSGAVTTALLHLQVMGVGFSWDADTVLALGVSFPAGAVLFRQRRRALIRAQRPMISTQDLDRLVR